ncbi:hypothetical protein ACFL3J_01225 [Candidatus Omnitrophota bacterium]
MKPKKTKETDITRSWPTLLFFVGLGVALWVVAFFLGRADHGGWAFILWLISFCCIVAGFLISGTGRCPNCGSELTQLMMIGKIAYEKCPACGIYLESEKKKLRAIELERIADKPEFSIVLPKKFTMPRICCVCGKTASRNERVTIDLSLVKNPSTSFFGTKAELSIDVPHCSEHKKGAKLDREVPKAKVSFESVTVGTRTDPVTVLKVRSYAFYNKFRQLNEIK